MERKERISRRNGFFEKVGVIENGHVTKVIKISAESLEEFRKKKDAWLRSENL